MKKPATSLWGTLQFAAIMLPWLAIGALGAPFVFTYRFVEEKVSDFLEGRRARRYSRLLRESKQYRQGDLLFISWGKIPLGAVRRRDAVVARGESTGHLHRVVDGAAYDNSFKEKLREFTYDSLFKDVLGVRGQRRVYLKAGPMARILLEEHEALELPPGVYLVIRQREFGGPDEGWTYVRD